MYADTIKYAKPSIKFLYLLIVQVLVSTTCYSISISKVQILHILIFKLIYID